MVLGKIGLNQGMGQAATKNEEWSVQNESVTDVSLRGSDTRKQIITTVGKVQQVIPKEVHRVQQKTKAGRGQLEPQAFLLHFGC